MNSESNPANKPVSNNYLFVDLETGGLYPTKHSILQVAAVITDLDFNIQGHFMSYVKPHPELEVTEQALAINKLTWENLEKAPPEKTVAAALHNFANLFAEKGRFAGYNCQFDLEFLSLMWQRHNIDVVPYHVPWLDIYTTAKSRLANIGLPNFKLVSVANHFGLNTDGAHDAIQDLFMTIQIAKYLKAMSQDLGGERGLDIETARFTITEYTSLQRISLSDISENMDSATDITVIESDLGEALLTENKSLTNSTIVKKSKKLESALSAGAELEAKIEQLKIAKLAIKGDLNQLIDAPTENQ